MSASRRGRSRSASGCGASFSNSVLIETVYMEASARDISRQAYRFRPASRMCSRRTLYSARGEEGESMPIFRLPLSGNVTQSINPWNWFFNPVGSQVGLINIDLGQSSNPAIEEEVLTDVASYGKQLGRIEDALLVLLAHFRPERPLTAEEANAIGDFKAIVEEIAAVKAKHQPRVAA